MSTTKPLATARTSTLPSTRSIATGATGHQGHPGPATQATQAVPAAQRQRAYRQRNKRAVIQAIGDEDHASRVTLLALLGQTLARLDDETATSRHSAARNSARRVINTLVTRYDINIEGQDRT